MIIITLHVLFSEIAFHSVRNYTGSNIQELHQKQPTGALTEVTLTVNKFWPSMRKSGWG